MSKVAIFEQRAPDTIAAESPLHYSLHRHAVSAHKEGASVVMAERAFLGHLIVRGTADVLRAAVKEMVGIALPETACGLNVDGEKSIQWLSPDEWLVILPPGEEFATEKALREALGEATYAIVNVSGGQTVLALSGPSAHEVLMKSTPCDVHPHAFPVGRGVSTVFAKTTVLLRRPDAEHWELVIRRSFADYLYRWLLDAGEEYGITTKHAENEDNNNE